MWCFWNGRELLFMLTCLWQVNEYSHVLCEHAKMRRCLSEYAYAKMPVWIYIGTSPREDPYMRRCANAYTDG